MNDEPERCRYVCPEPTPETLETLEERFVTFAGNTTVRVTMNTWHWQVVEFFDLVNDVGPDDRGILEDWFDDTDWEEPGRMGIDLHYAYSYMVMTTIESIYRRYREDFPTGPIYVRPGKSS